MKLHKDKKLDTISLQSIRSYSTTDCVPLLVEIGKIFGVDFKTYCKVKSLVHNYELKAFIGKVNSTISLKMIEKAGNTLEWKDEPSEIHSYSSMQLRNNAIQRKISGKTIEYKGILYGSVKSHECSPIEICPVCEGTGVCQECNGAKRITCPVCYGETKCVACDGTGIYTCRNCEGTGICPDCGGNGSIACPNCGGEGIITCPDCDGYGVITCPDCDGYGVITCPDCDGTGNYIDEPCTKCGGTGYYTWEKKCYACNGTGQYVVECRRCKGGGEITCRECDGEGTVECEKCDGEGTLECRKCHGNGVIKCKECKGNGTCSHCHGKGSFQCKACGGTGVCGKCKGKGDIWCPACHGTAKCSNCQGEKHVKCSRCNGTGVYQTFTEYSLKETVTTRNMCSFSLNDTCFDEIKGDLCYDDVVYDFFGNKANVYNLEYAVDSTSGVCVNLLKEWLALDKNSILVDDKLVKECFQLRLRLYKIPMTKIVLEYKSNEFTIWIVGNNKILCYDNIPDITIGDKIIAKFRNLFS